MCLQNLFADFYMALLSVINAGMMQSVVGVVGLCGWLLAIKRDDFFCSGKICRKMVRCGYV